MKKLVALLLTVSANRSCIGFAAAEDDITLDVIICQYGNNTNNWFTGTGIDGSNFVTLVRGSQPRHQAQP
jgi:multiple sugar transport system substrate-binding protein